MQRMIRAMVDLPIERSVHIRDNSPPGQFAPKRFSTDIHLLRLLKVSFTSYKNLLMAYNQANYEN